MLLRQAFSLQSNNDHKIKYLGGSKNSCVSTDWGASFTSKNKEVVWLTDYSNIETEHVEKLKLVPLGDKEFVAIWEKWSRQSYTSTFAMVVDEYGNTLTSEKDLGVARIHRRDDTFVLNGKAAWIIAEENPARLVLYTLNGDLTLNRFELP